MSQSQPPYHDTLTVTNGPEDGARFVLTESPILIGRDSQCIVNLQLDVTVQPEHARATADKGGFRVRRLTVSPVYVNGKRVGHIRSSKLESGGIIRVGYTELALSCAPNGLAARAKSRITDTDAAWALRTIGSLFTGFSKQILRGGRVAGRYVVQHWFLTLAVIVVVIMLQPDLRATALGVLRRLREVLGL